MKTLVRVTLSDSFRIRPPSIYRAPGILVLSDQIWKVHLCIGRTIWYLVQWSNNRKVWHRPLLDPSTRWGAQPARGTPRHLLTGGGGQPSPRACPVPVPVALF